MDPNFDPGKIDFELGELQNSIVDSIKLDYRGNFARIELFSIRKNLSKRKRSK